MYSPNFAQWMTVLPALKVFLDNYTCIYFIAVAIKQSENSSAAINQSACSLLGLMNTATGPPGTLNDDPKRCPPLYAAGLFVCAFGEAYFERHFEWLLRNDPKFGRDSYGQTALSTLSGCT